MTKSEPRLLTLRYWIGSTWMKLWGWKFEGNFPAQGKFVLIVAPHTSGWDFPHMIAVMFWLRTQVSWLGKHTLFQPPFGRLLRGLGGVPVDRRSSHGLVEQIAELFSQQDNLIIGMAPESTRVRTDSWKSGFYHIACRAQVPILPCYIDYPQKQVGLGPALCPSGNVVQDMGTLRTFYQNFRGANPDQESVIVLKEEQSG
ncbi:MAG: lysophospholipid acyltransferase family protein [SAR324 cluster bacterium]|nr:lysophospholipid acyltransferase family protein [SAR324 cluster bacterium]